MIRVEEFLGVEDGLVEYFRCAVSDRSRNGAAVVDVGVEDPDAYSRGGGRSTVEDEFTGCQRFDGEEELRIDEDRCVEAFQIVVVGSAKGEA